MSRPVSLGADWRGEWPALRLEEWAATRDTLHMWLQIVGKVKLAKAPMVNHWWQITLYPTPRGLTTGVIPDGATAFEIAFDFCDHELKIELEGGERRTVALEPKSVAKFYSETLAALGELGIDVAIWTKPVEVERAIPFERDEEHAAYDPDQAQRFWRQLLQADRVLKEFRGRFIGKVSPVHLFWGGLDLAVTRFSGRPAPRHPGGAPNVGDWVMVEAYSHEVSSAGFWPGGGGEEGAFYSYAYPIPDGFGDYTVAPAAAFYSDELGEFLLPYEAVRTAPDPDAALLEFLQTTYEATAELGQWDRRALEDDPARRARPR
jgi:uncharacterized protein DUF5996